jgi:hypothetical protein
MNKDEFLNWVDEQTANLENPDSFVAEQLSNVYKVAHGFNTNNLCFHSHHDWREKYLEWTIEQRFDFVIKQIKHIAEYTKDEWEKSFAREALEVSRIVE